MMKTFKILFWQAMMIVFGIIVGISVQSVIWHLRGKSFMLDWYQIPSLLLTGVVCALPSILLIISVEWPRKKYILMIICHCILLYVIVLSLGWLFKWFDTISGATAITIEYFVVYAFVWLVTKWMGWLDQKNINEVLNNIRDDE